MGLNIFGINMLLKNASKMVAHIHLFFQTDKGEDSDKLKEGANETELE